MVVDLDMPGTLIYITLEHGYRIKTPVALSQELYQVQNLVGGTRKRAETWMYLSQIFAGYMTLVILQIGTVMLFVSY